MKIHAVLEPRESCAPPQENRNELTFTPGAGVLEGDAVRGVHSEESLLFYLE